jgi:hypothetical protein
LRILSHIQLTLAVLLWKLNWMFLGYWILNNHEFCVWAHIAWTVIFLKIPPVFREMMSMIFCNLIKIVWVIFEKTAILFWGPIYRVPVLGARMLIFTAYWPVIDELLNTKFELNLSNCSGISYTHTRAHTPCAHIPLLHIQKGSKLWSVSISEDQCFISDGHSTSSYIHITYMRN